MNHKYYTRYSENEDEMNNGMEETNKRNTRETKKKLPINANKSIRSYVNDFERIDLGTV